MLGWLGIVRLGLVQMSLGAIVVLTTSTMNRVMVVELALPAIIPGLLVALHHAVQVMRPRMGYGSDIGGRRTPWILGGMVVLALGGIGAAAAIAVMVHHAVLGVALAVISFLGIGLGIAAAGTSLLVLLAKQVEPRRRAPAATIVWVMMLVGFAVTAGVSGQVLDPFSPLRLIAVTAGVSVLAVAVTALALWRIETVAHAAPTAKPTADASVGFRAALAEVWAEPHARRFAVFVFISMLGYSAQDLILEPFAGEIFGLTPGQTTSLTGLQHAGVLIGMIVIACAGYALRGRGAGSMRLFTIGGCAASAVALTALALAGLIGSSGWPIQANVFLLGLANGAYAVAAIGSMMSLVSAGRASREGVRMGLWGAAQAIAFGLGGILSTGAVDLIRLAAGDPATAYASVFAAEAVLFIAAAFLASKVYRAAPQSAGQSYPSAAGGPVVASR